MFKTLNELAKSIENYDKDDSWAGISKEYLEETYKKCAEVYNSINIIELQLLWYLRKSKDFYLSSYLDSVIKAYEASHDSSELQKATENNDIDKL